MPFRPVSTFLAATLSICTGVRAADGDLDAAFGTAGKAQLARERNRWAQLVDAIGRIMNPAPASKE